MSQERRRERFGGTTYFNSEEIMRLHANLFGKSEKLFYNFSILHKIEKHNKKILTNNDIDMSIAIGDLSSQRIVSGICGAGIVLFCESQYSCLKLFKRRTTLFFFMIQLAIWASSLETMLTTLMYFSPNMRILPTYIFILITGFILNVSYPIMILLRLRLIQNFSIYIMTIPVILTVVLTVLRYFWMHSVLVNADNCSHSFHIILRSISATIINIYIIINIFFIVVAITRFKKIFHIRCTIIVNIIIITLEGFLIVVEFAIIKQCFVLNLFLCVISISEIIKIRLEIEILSYIKKSVQKQCINNEEYVQ